MLLNLWWELKYYIDGECGNKNCLKGEADMTYNIKQKRKTNKDTDYNNSSRRFRSSIKCDSFALWIESRQVWIFYSGINCMSEWVVSQWKGKCSKKVVGYRFNVSKKKLNPEESVNKNQSRSNSKNENQTKLSLLKINLMLKSIAKRLEACLKRLRWPCLLILLANSTLYPLLFGIVNN